MDVFELCAKLKLDSSEFDKGLSGAAEKAKSIGQGIGNAVGTVAKVTAAGVTAASTAVGVLAKQSVDAYADYEQLAGGVETLFKGSADAVMENAKRAYETAGLSANDYMETVTSFSASLIQSTGRGAQTDLEQLKQTLDDEYKATKRSLEDQYKEAQKFWSDKLALAKDTEEKDAIKAQRDEMLRDLKRSNEDQLAELKQHNKDAIAEAEKANNVSVTTEESLAKAAKLADMAIVDMSDNANKMGTQMESLQNAYNGFSKGTFTMLDNLKLGYGGTKDEMERLLQDAEQIKAKQGEVADYSISSYADIVEAIHVVQEEMGITGTTQEEASKTISGSLNMVKGAWTNLIAGFANDSANLDQLISDVVSSAETALNNILPAVEKALKGIGSFVEKIAPIIGERLPALVQTVLPMIINAATSLFNSVARALPSLINTIISIIPSLIQTIVNVITTQLPKFISLAGQVVMTIVKGILQNISALTNTAVQVIVTLADGLSDALPELIPATVEAILTIVEGLLDNADKLIESAAKLITALGEGLIKSLDILLKRAPIIVSKLTSAIIQNAPKLLQAATELISKLAVYIVKNLPKIVGVAAQVIVSFIGGLAKLYQQLNNAGRDIIVSVWNGLKTLNPWKWGADLINEFINGIASGIRSLVSTVSNVASTVWSYLHFSEPEVGPLADFHTYAPDMIDLFVEGLRKGSGRLQKQLADTFSFNAPTIASGVSQNVYSAAPITVNVYGAQGQDEKALADAVIERLNFTYNRQQRAFA